MMGAVGNAPTACMNGADMGQPGPLVTVNREGAVGMRMVSLSRPGIDQYFLTATPRSGRFGQMLQETADLLEKRNATVVAQDIFAPVNGPEDCREILSQVGRPINWPVTWVQSGHGHGSTLGGIVTHAISGPSVEQIRVGGRVVASVYEDQDAKYCRLGDIRSAETTGDRTAQAADTFEMIETVLRSAGMNLSDLLRTWLYLDELLSWYGSFNEVRTDFLRNRDMFGRLVPASTGISGANPFGAAVMAGALGVRAKSDAFGATAVASPLQCPALEYGSSFSRAVEFGTPNLRYLTVSGTASIEPGGETAHLDDIDGQIDLTMRVVQAILESREMAWDNAVRVIAYVKQAGYAPALERYCAARGLSDLPMIVTENHICRDDLLFEIEADAVLVKA